MSDDAPNPEVKAPAPEPVAPETKVEDAKAPEAKGQDRTAALEAELAQLREEKKAREREKLSESERLNAEIEELKAAKDRAQAEASMTKGGVPEDIQQAFLSKDATALARAWSKAAKVAADSKEPPKVGEKLNPGGQTPPKDGGSPEKRDRYMRLVKPARQRTA